MRSAVFALGLAPVFATALFAAAGGCAAFDSESSGAADAGSPTDGPGSSPDGSSSGGEGGPRSGARVFVVGGQTGPGAALVLSAKVFSSRVAPDGTLEPWQAQASLPAARHALGAASHGDRLFAIGGEIGVDPGNSSATTEVLATTVSSEGALGGWSAPPAGTLAQARYFHATATTATHVYALGGATFGMALDTVLVGTLAPNGVTWTPGLSLPAARSRGAAIATHGSVYVVGGGEGTTCRSTILRAPILAGGALGAWQDEVNASFDAKYPALAVHGDHLYVLGGEGCASGLRQAAWVATIASDGSLGALQPTTALPQPRKGAGAFVAADRLYLVAGDDGGGESAAVHSSVVGADGQLGSWRPEEGLPDGAGFFGLVVR